MNLLTMTYDLIIFIEEYHIICINIYIYNLGIYTINIFYKFIMYVYEIIFIFIYFNYQQMSTFIIESFYYKHQCF